MKYAKMQVEFVFVGDRPSTSTENVFKIILKTILCQKFNANVWYDASQWAPQLAPEGVISKRKK